MALLVDVRCERIPHPDLDGPLPLDRLRSGRLSTVNWPTLASGIQINDGVDDLGRIWAEHVGLFAAGTEDFGELTALEGEAKEGASRGLWPAC